MNDATQLVDIEVIGSGPAISLPENPFSAPSPAGARVVAGYELLEHIGEGGFGSVWRAKAPGGMLKAVKLVHGGFNERRAVEESKSLEKIRDARHPFLLSLERIEIVDGQLIVVTELADESLKQRYERCVATGSPGIPRDDLLRMLAEAADALDYMSKQHGLAHLDIKPENILLVGDHVKVADFGLVKSVHTSQQSLVGGLTPLFAAPETFDGQPSDRSDQYSLAVVYQFALTGKLPFTGQTTAQLAAQHISARPDLSSLPDVDRLIVERALEKDPFDRFDSCRAFVERLAAIKTTVVIPGARSDDEAEPFHTEVIGDEQSDAPTTTTGTIGLPKEAPIVDLPPLKLEADNRHRPTLVIALGGCGAKTLKALMRRLEAQHGPCESIPWFDALVIDTDYDEYIACFVNDEDSALPERQFVHVPLKPTQYYRQHAGELTRWMSRRWIYNIPKSQKPDGVRPLGRLALVDQVQQVEKQLNHAVGKLCRPPKGTEAEQGENKVIDYDSPEVFLVGSLSGGTGGAIVSDVAQMVHRAFNEREMPNVEIVCLLAHWTGSSTEATELSTVNTAAALAELHHYQTDGCPGDVTCHLPALGRHHGLFKHVYYVDLGWHGQRTSFEAAADRLAGYLEANMASDLAQFGAACRHTTMEHERRISVTRTFEFATLDATELVAGSPLANRLAERVFQGFWDLERTNELVMSARHATQSAEAALQLASIKQHIAVLHQRQANDLLPADMGRDALDDWKQRVAETFSSQPILRNPDDTSASDMQAAVAKILHARAAALHQAVIHATNESPSPVAFCEELLSQLCNQLEVAKRRSSDDDSVLDIDPANAEFDSPAACSAYVQQFAATSTHRWLVQVIEILQSSLRHQTQRILDTKRAVARRSQGISTDDNTPDLDESLYEELMPKWREWIDEQCGDVGSFILRHTVDLSAAQRFLLDTAQELLTSRRLTEISAVLRPDALRLGGARRVLIAAPQSVIDSDLFDEVKQQLSHPPTWLPLEGSSILLWCEGEQIKIADLLDSLVGHRPELQELAGQLHVRNDIAWAKP